MNGTADGPSATARPRAVTLDFWNTLVAENATGSDRLRRWRDVLEAHDLRVTDEQISAAMEAGWQWFEQRWRANHQVGTREAIGAALERLPVPVPDAAADDLTDVIVAGFPPEEMRVASSVGDCLERLASSGVRIGIICDVGLTPSSTLRSYLDHHGLLGHFDHWSFSDEVGCYKPDPRIFAHAADGLGRPAPDRTVHVGDLRRTDVAGARGVGWRSVRYCGLADDAGDGPEADHVVDDHAHLADVLGL